MNLEFGGYALERTVRIFFLARLVVHTCILSYSGGRDQEDLCLKPNSFRDPISKKALHKKGLVEWLQI
jgi:hypothetical protein